LNGNAIDLTPPYTTDGTDLSASGLENVTLLTFIDENLLIPDAAWTVAFVGKNNADYLLESEEKAVITLWMANLVTGAYALGTDDTDPFIDAEADLLDIYDTFTIEVRSEKGAVLVMERSIPGRFDTVMDLK
jgi:archaellin